MGRPSKGSKQEKTIVAHEIFNNVLSGAATPHYPETVWVAKNLPPIKLWASALEKGAMDQAKNMVMLPYVHSHAAVMADAHSGYGVPIGGVLALDGYVIPNAVGLDIGCGMQAVQFPLRAADVPRGALQGVVEQIKATIPVGFTWHNHPQAPERMPEWGELNTGTLLGEIEKAELQLGTLGGGNHFIELQRDEEGNLWAMVHSGSRNIGKQVAEHHHEIAKDTAERTHLWLPDKDLACLSVNGELGQAYLADMDYCLRFARANRDLMMDQVIEAVRANTGCTGEPKFRHDIHHNFAAIEEHLGKKVVVHRKGATRAFKDQVGIIPGSQGTASYIVEGLGNPESFMSCSHGSGRRMSRGRAKRELDLAAEIARLDEQGIIHGIRTTKELDEAAGAYKDIEEVMANQADLVRPLVRLTPLAVVKG